MFNYLNIKTDASMGDSIITVKPLVAKLKGLGYNAVGIMNTNNLFDSVAMYKECKKNDMKAIIGAEVYVYNREDENTSKALLMVKNDEGYRNLSRIVSHANESEKRDKQYIVDYAYLVEHTDGLIMIDFEGNYISFECFGDDYYIGTTQDRQKNNELHSLAISNRLQIVAVPSFYYLNEEDALFHESYMAISDGLHLSDPTIFESGHRRVLPNDQCHYINDDKESVSSQYIHSELNAIQEIIDKCNFEYTLDEMRLPKFDIGDYPNALECLKQKLRDSWVEKKIGELNIDDIYLIRLKAELADIETAGIADYFLMVQDVMDWARQQNIKVGYGRGSAAGSLVAWMLDIQFPNPIEHGLIWERFYNLGRGLSLPDIDMDFSQLDRPQIVQYLKDKYGHKCVANTVTFATFGTRASIQYALKVLSVPAPVQFKITKLVPYKAKNIKDAISQSPELEHESNTYKLSFEIAKKIEGLKSHKGIHASAIMISNDALSEQIPMSCDEKKHELATGYDMYSMDDQGYLKLDVLGIRNLDILKDVEAQVNE